ALLNHPLVSEAAVIGVDDPLKGLRPMAFVVLRGGADDRPGIEAELSDQIVRAIGAMARPGRVHLVPALPKTRSGKIMRRLLREILSTGQARGDTSALENPDSLEVLLQLPRS
ncbi:MAG TPA: acetyl-coenzyme A synthetase, partial [Candidatus Dormibacteraeota bacterium]|nr:acetyl-coenzyme A synthetase [Candidatus Dormibacteraeota bacterium]